MDTLLQLNCLPAFSTNTSFSGDDWDWRKKLEQWLLNITQSCIPVSILSGNDLLHRWVRPAVLAKHLPPKSMENSARLSVQLPKTMKFKRGRQDLPSLDARMLKAWKSSIATSKIWWCLVWTLVTLHVPIWKDIKRLLPLLRPAVLYIPLFNPKVQLALMLWIFSDSLSQCCRSSSCVLTVKRFHEDANLMDTSLATVPLWGSTVVGSVLLATLVIEY